MKSIILCVLLVLAINGNEFFEEEAFFNRLVQKEYGRTIIQTIQLELGQDNAVNRIVGLLKQLQADLNAENQRASAAQAEREQYCKAKIAEVDEYAERVITKKAEYEAALPLRQEELRDKIRQSEQRSAELQRNKERQDNFSQIRQQEHQEYEQRRDELIGMVNGLKEAQNIIRQLKSGSFVEVRETVLTQLQSHKAKLFEDIPRKTGFKALSQMLLELCSDAKIHADQDTVEVILNIIDELVESIYEVQKDEMFADDQKTKYFTQDLARLQIQNNRLTNLNASDNAVIELLQGRLNELEQQISVSQMVLESKAVERADYMTSCYDDKESQRELQDQRNEQAQVIQQLIDLFENNFSDRLRTMLAQITVQ